MEYRLRGGGIDIVSTRSIRLSALSVALLSASQGWAIGFGDIILHSRIGEPLRAEVPITADASERLEATCFTLAPMNGSDLPVISNAKTRLVREGDNYRLHLTGSKPISEPIFLVGLRAGCGIDLQRDFVLMPAEPLVLAAQPSAGNGAPAAAVPTRSQRGGVQEMRASEGDTLESIAETLVPDNLARQRRMLAALKRANPQLSGRPALPDGTLVAIPDVKQRVSAERDNLPTQQERSASPPPPPPPPKVSKPAAAPKPTGGDRVLLGAPPEDIKPGEKAVPPKASKEEFDARMARMEETIKLLNTQIEALDKALALTAETLALRQKLQAAEAATGTLPAPVAKPLEPPPPPTNDSNWLEILLSALAGGLVAGGFAHLLSRRREQRMAPSQPLAMPREPVVKREFAEVKPAAAGSASSSTIPEPVDIAPEVFSRAPEDIKQINVEFNHDESAIALAEIMLSFGRPQGATETLARHIDETASDNPRPWLMLLDLYQRSGLKDDYMRLLPAMRSKFNVQPPSWEELRVPVSGLKSLEDYQHIIARITATWGSQEGMDYLYELVHDNRDGQRSGFPLEVVEEIVLLLLVLEAGYGLQRKR